MKLKTKEKIFKNISEIQKDEVFVRLQWQIILASDHFTMPLQIALIRKFNLGALCKWVLDVGKRKMSKHANIISCINQEGRNEEFMEVFCLCSFNDNVVRWKGGQSKETETLLFYRLLVTLLVEYYFMTRLVDFDIIKVWNLIKICKSFV